MKKPKKPTTQNTPTNDAGQAMLDAETLSARLGRLKKSVDRPTMPARDNNIANGYNYGATMAVEMFVTLLVGIGFGWGLDKWLGTRPWLTIIFGFLGILASIVNILRVTAPRR